MTRGRRWPDLIKLLRKQVKKNFCLEVGEGNPCVFLVQLWG